MSDKPEWYVVHTYSGYENKVKANIEKIVENRGMQDQVFDIRVPMQDAVEMKNGKRKEVQRKVIPGYVLIKMIMNDDTWYIVRNTRGVTSFVGPGSKPVPLTESEILRLGIESLSENFEYEVGDIVKVIDGLFDGTIAKIEEVNPSRRTVTVKISAFGRETPTEFQIGQVERFEG